MQTIDALGVSICNTTLKQTKLLIAQFLRSNQFHQITTVNPDFVMIARQNEVFRDTLNSSDLAIADGIGIHLPALLQKTFLHGRIPGADLTEYILDHARQLHLSVCIVARNDGLSTADEIKRAILAKFPKLMVTGYDVDIHSSESLSWTLDNIQSDIVLANFGAPLQDTFLARLRAWPQARTRLAMGVGGTFDFMTGKQKRAPSLIRKIGLEWLWRLILRPRQRLKRTFNYVVIYSLLCLSRPIMHWIREGSPFQSLRNNPDPSLSDQGSSLFRSNRLVPGQTFQEALTIHRRYFREIGRGRINLHRLSGVTHHIR